MSTADLLDELAIRRVMERYMRHNDDRDLDRILTVFAEDATFRVGGVASVGHQAIGEFLRGVGYESGRAAWTDGDERLWVMPRSAHVMSNPVIDVDGDVASAEADFVVIERDEQGHAQIVLVGRYRDRFRRLADGRWVIADRVGVSMARRDAPE
jgi:ketosteroid isomerase-like protein